MVKEMLLLDEVIEFLNGLIKLDGPAMGALIANRVPCNQAFADHPTVQVAAQNGGYHVGFLGILNGMFGTDDAGWGVISFVFENGSLLRVERRDRNYGGDQRG
jgi:hypothetical protein